jgi:hypothetical protein
VANITIWGFDVPHVEVISAAQAKKQDIEEQRQKNIKTGDTTNQSVWDKILGTNQPTKSWGEYLFGISSTQIMIVVGGLGLFLIWTKLPSFKGKR